MSITRLQQARQMFRYGGDTMGGPNDKSNNGGSGNGAVDTVYKYAYTNNYCRC